MTCAPPASVACALLNMSLLFFRSYIYAFPESEVAFIRSLYNGDPDAALSFDVLLARLMGEHCPSTICIPLDLPRLSSLESPLPHAKIIIGTTSVSEAQANFAEPSAPLEYNSNNVLRNDMAKHTRRVLDPQQQFRKPLTTSQAYDLRPSIKALAHH